MKTKLITALAILLPSIVLAQQPAQQRPPTEQDVQLAVMSQQRNALSDQVVALQSQIIILQSQLKAAQDELAAAKKTEPEKK